MNLGAISALALAVIVLLQGAGHSVQAQDSVMPAPKRPQFDENGIDVTTGDEYFSIPLLSIGPEGRGGLSLSWSQIAGDYKDEFSNAYARVDADQGTLWESAAFGQYGDTFGPSAPPTYGRPGQLYEAADGTKINFDLLNYFSRDPSTEIYQYQYFASSITFPNDVKWKLHYKLVPGPSVPFLSSYNYMRLQSVTSNTGYQIKFHYKTNILLSDFSNSADWRMRVGATAINNSVEYCDPMADACQLSEDWPQASYSETTYNLQTEEAIKYLTDAGSGITRLRWKYTPGAEGGWLAVKRHGSATDDVIYYHTIANGPCVPNGQVIFAPPTCQQGGPVRVSQVVTPYQTTNYSYSASSAPGNFVITAQYPDSTTNRYEIARYPSTRGLRKSKDRIDRVSTYDSNSWGETTKLVYPEGNSVQTTRSFANCGLISTLTNVPKPGSLAASITQSSTPVSHGGNLKLCGKASSVFDFRNNESRFTYDPAHGGILTELSPPDGTGARKATRYYYAQRFAFIKNASGTFVQADSPVWLVAEKRTCNSSSLDLTNGTCTGGATDLVVTSYDYGSASGPNNLLLRGVATTSHGQTLRTCYNYDEYGHQISETSPNANLTSCS